MKITLKIKGQDKEFMSGFISGRKFRQAISIQKMMNDGETLTEDKLDKAVTYLVEVFENKFTIDDYYDGVESKYLIPQIIECINEVAGNVVSAAVGEQDPN